MTNKRAFTLVEILIVISLIVLILAMAMPAFNFITGGRSEDAATNQISAMLARARTEAVGLQEKRGVMFYLDPATDREMMVIVKEAVPVGAVNPNVGVWLDAEDADHLPLPKGIGIQAANDAGSSAVADRYIGFNVRTGTTVAVGSVILFDGSGRLVSTRCGLSMQKISDSPLGVQTITPSAMSVLLAPTTAGLVPNYPSTTLALNAIPLSSFGFVLFDRSVFLEKKDQGFGDDDPAVGDSAEENWIDQNATAVLINRYNGTLVKSE